jgi:hypothetical protein
MIKYKYKFLGGEDLKDKKRKMMAPIVVTVIMVAYYVLYFGLMASLLSGFWKYALGIIPLAFSVLMLKVCIERINEIKKGEEDDISKY